MSIVLAELSTDEVEAQLSESLLDVQRLAVIHNALTGDRETIKGMLAGLNGHVQATLDTVEARHATPEEPEPEPDVEPEPEPAPEHPGRFEARVVGDRPERGVQLYAQGRLAEIRRQFTARHKGKGRRTPGVSLPGSRRRAIEDAFALDPLRRFTIASMTAAIGDDRPDCVSTELAAIHNGPMGITERVGRGVYRSTLVPQP